MKKVILSIEGMTCSACSNGLEKFLNKQNGVQANVNLVMATASIEYDEKITISDLEKYVALAGFKSLGIANLEEENKKNRVLPFIVYGVLAIILMYISMAHMLDIEIPFLKMSKYPVNYSLVLLILTIPFLYYGFDIIKSGINNSIHKMPNMDTLVSLGIISSFLYSLFGVLMVIIGNVSYVHNLYFESTTFVIYFIKLGRYIDFNSKEKTKSAIKGLVTITPKIAKIKTSEGIKEVTIDEVKKGDILVCYAGEKIATDGVITDGESHFDEAFITGESVPVNKKKGDKVIAGSINFDGTIFYKAEKIGKDSMISEVVNLVMEATNTKAPISLYADRVSSYFVPIVLIISFITFICCLLFEFSFSYSLTRFVTVLVVSCPCALGLATPLAIVVSEGKLAKRGILVKSSEVIEEANKIDTIIFDKTGTLTKGNLTISKVYNYSSYSDKKLLSILGGIEYSSTHPIAKGVISYIDNKKIDYNKNLKIKNISGYGLKTTIDGVAYFVGNEKLLKKLNINNDYISDLEDLKSNGNSIVYIIEDSNIIGLIGVKDTIRDNAKEVINTLKSNNIEVIMLTGDNKTTASIVGKELGITNIISDVIPKEKSNVIKKLKKDNKKIIMVGDGINDAPSLTISDIGISISSGTDIAMDSADVILMKDDLSKIIDFLNISKKTLRNIKQNLFWAFLYNICMIPIAMGLFINYGISINPMIACISMIISSLFVIFNALRLKK